MEQRSWREGVVTCIKLECSIRQVLGDFSSLPDRHFDVVLITSSLEAIANAENSKSDQDTATSNAYGYRGMRVLRFGRLAAFYMVLS